MKIFSILILLLIPILVPSQTLKGVVLDNITNKTLPYASLALKDKNSGVYSNEDGTYSFNISKASGYLVLTSNIASSINPLPSSMSFKLSTFFFNLPSV